MSLQGEIGGWGGGTHRFETCSSDAHKLAPLVAGSGQGNGDQKRSETRGGLLLQVTLQGIVGRSREANDRARLVTGWTAEHAVDRGLGSLAQNVEQGNVQASACCGRRQSVQSLVGRRGTPYHDLAGGFEFERGKRIALPIAHQARLGADLKDYLAIACTGRSHLEGAYLRHRIRAGGNRIGGCRRIKKQQGFSSCQNSTHGVASWLSV